MVFMGGLKQQRWDHRFAMKKMDGMASIHIWYQQVGIEREQNISWSSWGGKNNISRPAVGSQICIEINVPTLEGFIYSAVCYFCFPTVNMTVLIAEGIGRGSVIICFHNSGTTGLGWIFSEQSIGEMGWVIPKKWPCPTRARPFLRNHLASTMGDL